MNRRRIGQIVLIVACICAMVIGFVRRPDYISVDNAAEKSSYVFDEAGVLNSSAVKAVEKANSSMAADLYVVTIKDTGSMTTEDYCYFWQEAHSLKQTDCELLIVTGTDSYWFIYGSALADTLDYTYDRLLDRYYVPYMDYSEAVQKFAAALADSIGNNVNAGNSIYAYAGGGGSYLGQFILTIIAIIVIIAIIRAISRRMYYWSGYNYSKPWYAPNSWWTSRPVIYRTYTVTPRDRYPSGYYYPTQRTYRTAPSSGTTYRGNGWGNPPPTTTRSSSGFTGGGGSRSSRTTSYSSPSSSSRSSRSFSSSRSSSGSSFSSSRSSSSRSSFSSSRSSSSGRSRSGFSGGGGTRGKK